jgi:cbb3-type cytochrome oxidase maturation protein
MSVLFILIGISLLIALGFLMAFLWASKTGQYEDDYSPSVRILFDDQPNKNNPGTGPGINNKQQI